MEFKLYNTLTRQKDAFDPIDANNIRMYVCGPTVYDLAHIGNARPVVVFDVLFRLLRHLFGAEHVTYARNITDVDDKINARAAEEGIDIRELTEKTAAQYHSDMSALRALPPTVEPRATDHIAEMHTIIGALIQRGHAYEAEGHVLFHVPSMSEYGQLSRRSVEDMRAGARIDVAPYKKDPMDFVLWKPSKEGEPAWDSPWGAGRPGWHVECSAMAEKHLGTVFDIHGGGIDLVFPHHENEIAQSCGAHATERMANIWMHNGFLQVEGEKMAKSQGNFITVKDLLGKWPGEAIRLALLTTHYRQPIDFTMNGLGEAKSLLDTWYRLTENAPEDAAVSDSVLTALTDDLNTPQAMAALHQLRADAAKGDQKAMGELKASARLLGLLEQSSEDWFAWRPEGFAADDQEIEKLIAARIEARNAKDFATSDRIRDELVAKGVVLMDSKNEETGALETSWSLK
ncbi:MAG: cysteine--tRNA ligase [Stappiaceae bacterium]